MCKKEFTRDAADDGIHETVEFNEYRSAEYWTAFWSRRMRRAFVLEKLAPYLLVLGIVVAFLVIGYMESAL
jgi:hypothetical protein